MQIELNEQQVAALQAYAEKHGMTIESAAAMLLSTALVLLQVKTGE